MKRAVGTLAALLALTTSVDAAPKKRPRQAPVVVPFSATAAFGENVPILRHGPITLFLLCDNGQVRADNSQPIDVATLFVRSDVPGMLVTGERNFAAHLFTGSVPDGRGWYTAPDRVPVGGITIDFDEVGSGGSAITPDGFVLTVPADGVGFGIATHRVSSDWATAPDCFVTGVALLMRAEFLTE
jgi:hypothetical protein